MFFWGEGTFWELFLALGALNENAKNQHLSRVRKIWQKINRKFESWYIKLKTGQKGSFPRRPDCGQTEQNDEMEQNMQHPDLRISNNSTAPHVTHMGHTNQQLIQMPSRFEPPWGGRCLVLGGAWERAGFGYPAVDTRVGPANVPLQMALSAPGTFGAGRSGIF